MAQVYSPTLGARPARAGRTVGCALQTWPDSPEAREIETRHTAEDGCGSHAWYREVFGELYPLLYPHRNDEAAAHEAAAFVRLVSIGGPGTRVLDLACGAARHAQALCSFGAHVWGLDLSAHLLQLAARRGCLDGRIVRADMCRLPFRPAFDLVVNLFTSFGYFPDDKLNADVLGEVFRVLLPRGVFLLDHLNRPALERALVAEDVRRGDGFTIRQRRRIEGRRIRKRIEISWDDGRIRGLEEDVRLYTAAEMKLLLQEAGFSRVRFYGSFQGDALTEGSERMIAVAAKDLAGRT
ncbi:MAG: class I SAM-dependent methyltransferase [Candidatus Eisenbacteria bacterium]